MAAPAPSAGFVAELPGFTGTLAELAAALRAGRVPPGAVGLLTLTRDVLAWAQALTGGLAIGGLGTEKLGTGDTAPGGRFAEAQPELLPTLATVIALKARLLLPAPELPDDDAPDGGLDEVLEGVEALAELDALVGFLAARRREREGLLPARPAPVDLPRRERPRNPAGSLARLVRAAQNAVKTVDVPLLARERLTLADALGALRAFGTRLRHFTFRGLPAQDWPEQTTYFAALLEGVREGSFSARQAEVYGEITVESHVAEG